MKDDPALGRTPRRCYRPWVGPDATPNGSLWSACTAVSSSTRSTPPFIGQTKPALAQRFVNQALREGDRRAAVEAVPSVSHRLSALVPGAGGEGCPAPSVGVAAGPVSAAVVARLRARPPRPAIVAHVRRLGNGSEHESSKPTRPNLVVRHVIIFGHGYGCTARNRRRIAAPHTRTFSHGEALATASIVSPARMIPVGQALPPPMLHPEASVPRDPSVPSPGDTLPTC